MRVKPEREKEKIVIIVALCGNNLQMGAILLEVKISESL